MNFHHGGEEEEAMNEIFFQCRQPNFLQPQFPFFCQHIDEDQLCVKFTILQRIIRLLNYDQKGSC